MSKSKKQIWNNLGLEFEKKFQAPPLVVMGVVERDGEKVFCASFAPALLAALDVDARALLDDAYGDMACIVVWAMDRAHVGGV